MALIAPHGGTLINRIVSAEAQRDATAVALSAREAFDLEMLAIGAFSPLPGFMGEADFQSVCRSMRLSNRAVWPIPIILSPADDVTARINKGDRIALSFDGKTVALMTVKEKY